MFHLHATTVVGHLASRRNCETHISHTKQMCMHKYKFRHTEQDVALENPAVTLDRCHLSKSNDGNCKIGFISLLHSGQPQIAEQQQTQDDISG